MQGTFNLMRMHRSLSARRPHTTRTFGPFCDIRAFQPLTIYWALTGAVIGSIIAPSHTKKRQVFR